MKYLQRQSFSSILSGRKMPILAAAAGMILTISSLWAGLIADDYHHKILMTYKDTRAKILDSPLDMFRFFDGGNPMMAESVDYGLLPWWTDLSGNLKAAFWRPLASLTHWLDYILWPNYPPLMHLQSIIWYGGLIFVTGLLYHRFMGLGYAAGLAVLLFAIDDAHGMPVGFLSNRNAIMAAFFGVLAILAHARWREENRRAGIFWGPILLAASLLSAEAGVSTCAYLAAYVFCLDKGRWGRKISSLIPYAVIVIVWRLLWTHLGYGVAEIGGYVDPLREPIRYLIELKNRIPFLMAGQWALPPSDFSTILTPGVWNIFWYAGCGFIVFLILMFIPLLKKDKTARFWAVAMALSLFPICATFPADRLLIFVGIGAMGLVSQFIMMLTRQNDWRPKTLLWRCPAVLLLVFFVFTHIVISPVHLVIRARYPMGVPKIMDRLIFKGPLDDQIKDKTLVLVNPPVAFLVLVSAMSWAGNDEPMPAQLRVLTSSLLRPVKVERPDEKTLIVQPEYGYYAFILDRLFRSDKHRFSSGDQVRLTGMTAEIRRLTNDGRPLDVAFIFSSRLEDPNLVWFQHKDGRFVPFKPPAIGESISLAGEKLFP